MSAKITVIVPIYNTEKYLNMCLESILSQTFSDLQIICINDGSTDNSLSILKQYASQDKRILLIDQENKGYGAAMNVGLNLADGQYIAIVESDDFIDQFMYEAMFQIADRCRDTDIIKFAYWDYYDNPDGTHRIEPSLSSRVETHLYPFKIEQYPELLIYHPSVWTCLYRREFLEAHKIRFIEPLGAGWSDNPFFFSTLIQAKKIIWSNEKHYYYRRTNPECSSNLKDCTIPFRRLWEILCFFDENNITNPVILDYFYKRCLIYAQDVVSNQYFDPDEMYKYMTKVISKIDPERLKQDFYTKEERRMHALFYRTKEEL